MVARQNLTQTRIAWLTALAMTVYISESARLGWPTSAPGLLRLLPVLLSVALVFGLLNGLVVLHLMKKLPSP